MCETLKKISGASIGPRRAEVRMYVYAYIRAGAMADVTLTIDLNRLPLGRGAFSTVYPAETADGRKIAAKIVGNTDGDIVPTIREMLFTATLCHPNILAAVTCGIVPSDRKPPSWTHAFRPAVYMGFPRASETLHTLNLRTHRDVRTGKAPPWTAREATKALAGVGEAVAFLHGVGVIHRDIKPQNIMMFTGDHVPVAKLGDLGLAVNTTGTALVCADPKPPRWVAADDKDREYLTSAVVTRPYRAPELCIVGTAYDERVDDWSFGCVLFETLLSFEPTCARVEYLFSGGGAAGGRTDERVARKPVDRAWWYGADTRGQLAAIARMGVFFTEPDQASPVRMVAVVTECHARVVGSTRKPLAPLCAQLARRLPSIARDRSDLIGLLCQLLYPWPTLRGRCGAARAMLDPSPADDDRVATDQGSTFPVETEGVSEPPRKRSCTESAMGPATGPRVEDILPDGVPMSGKFQWRDIVDRTNELIGRRSAYEQDR